MIVEQNYWKVSIEYIQETELLVVAKDADTATAMVRENVLDTTRGFKVNAVTELSDEEKEYVIRSMMGVPEEGEPEPVEERTLN